jgi:hypothetical protein
MVGKSRQRFVARRQQGLYDEPPVATHWTGRLTAEASGLSKSTVLRVIQLFAL